MAEAYTYSFLRVLPKTETTFLQYFEQEMTPAQAKAYHETELIACADDNASVVAVLADVQLNPTDPRIYHLYETWRYLPL